MVPEACSSLSSHARAAASASSKSCTRPASHAASNSAPTFSRSTRHGLFLRLLLGLAERNVEGLAHRVGRAAQGDRAQRIAERIGEIGGDLEHHPARTLGSQLLDDLEPLDQIRPRAGVVALPGGDVGEVAEHHREAVAIAEPAHHVCCLGEHLARFDVVLPPREDAQIVEMGRDPRWFPALRQISSASA